MVTLTLLRHGEAEGAKAGSHDMDRRLTHRGKDDIATAGSFMKEHDITPDFILCSDAKRTRETLSCLKPSFESNIPVQYSNVIYSCASGQALIHLLEDVPSPYKHVLLIGHNPTLHEMALMLTIATSDNTRPDRKLAEDYPTSTLCHIELKAQEWPHVHLGGKLIHFVSPRH